MTDWADEIAESLIHDDYNEDGPAGVYANASEIAHALRAAELRGRVAGMREAAEIAAVFGGSGGCSEYASGMHDAIGNATRYILDAATKLESSPTT